MGSEILLVVTGSDEDVAELQAAAGDDYVLLVAEDALQCIQMAGQSPRLIVVSDQVAEPDSACADIRKDPLGSAAPMILLADEDSRLSTADVDGVVSRPVDSGVLVAWLQVAHRIAQLRRGHLSCGGVTKQNCEQLLRSFARLSHAVNNPLQALYATVDMLMLNHGLTEEASSLASEVITHAGRVAQLVAEASGEAKQVLQVVAPEKRTRVQ